MNWLENAWLKVLDLRVEILIGICVACVLIVFLANGHAFYLNELPKLVLGVISALAILAFCLTLARLAKALFAVVKNWWNKRVLRSNTLKNEGKVLVYLDSLSEDERKVLSYLVQKNQQSFNADMTARNVVTLKQKHLIVMGAGAMDVDDAPFIVPPFVWAELQVRKAEFNTANLSGPHPWRDHWMT